MYAIKHLFHINASFEKVYDAITTIDGLKSWWTPQTTGSSEIGNVLEFRFGGTILCFMQVISKAPNTYLEWECVNGHLDWIGTQIIFQLDDHEDMIRIRFEHSGWKDANDFFGQCNFAWGRYMESLRLYCETGEGKPFKKE
ncbi:SRPBCC domain-containing protein [Bacteroidota bacterium]